MNHNESAKLALRDQLVTARGKLGVAEIAARAAALADLLLASAEIRGAATVAAYASVGREPGTGLLLEGLRAAGARVILPLLLPDNDLDWCAYTGPDTLVSARRGLLEPVGPALGPAAIAGADAVLVPALAVDERGHRLGRGGGSYDRALARVPVGTFVCAILNDSELLRRVPIEPHDRAVTAVATERRIIRF